MSDSYGVIISPLREFLGEEGLAFFSDIRERFGRISAIGHMGPGSSRVLTSAEASSQRKADPSLLLIPHPVHFREGMQVRNFLRTLSECKDWTSHDLDDRWEGLVERAIDVGGVERGRASGSTPQ